MLRPADVDAVRNAGGPRDGRLLLRSGLRTPSEAFQMIAAGVDALKLFPAEGRSPAGLTALRAVLPQDLAVIPVGGISEKRLSG